MMVMLANNSGATARSLAARYPGRIGHLYSPGGERGPFDEFPYALDNGAFSAWTSGEEWNKGAWLDLVGWAKAAETPPLWAAVPDVVADAAATIRSWFAYSHHVAATEWPLAFVAQDGMSVRDVPTSANVVFIGGSTEWKRKALGEFTRAFERVHVGRVNGYSMLDACYELGVESVDGTGWLRGDKRQLGGLVRFLDETSDQGQIRMPWMR